MAHIHSRDPGHCHCHHCHHHHLQKRVERRNEYLTTIGKEIMREVRWDMSSPCHLVCV